MPADLAIAQEWIDYARRILVLTGAGVSAESGVPTFRGPEGLWRNFDPTRLATPEAFRDDPKLVWEWYDWRRQKIAACKPNPAHDAIARLEQTFGERFLLVTQNVDGLHEMAGSRRLARMHGSIWHVCRADGKGRTWEDRRVPMDPLPPRDEDGTLLRPAVVWYGETIPYAEVTRVETFAMEGLDVVLVVGTSGLITYIQSWLHAFRGARAKLVEVNTEPSAISDLASCCLYGPAGEILPELLG